MLANAEGNSVRQRIAELSFSRRVRDFPVASVQALLQVRSVGETVEQQWRDALAAAHRDFLAPLRSRKGVQQLQYATLQRLEKTYTPEHGRPPSLAHIRTPSVFAALVAQVRRRFQGPCAALKTVTILCLQAFHPFFEKPDDTTRDLCVKLLAFASQGRKGVDLTSHTARVYQNVASIARVRSVGASTPRWYPTLTACGHGSCATTHTLSAWSWRRDYQRCASKPRSFRCHPWDSCSGSAPA